MSTELTLIITDFLGLTLLASDNSKSNTYLCASTTQQLSTIKDKLVYILNDKSTATDWTTYENKRISMSRGKNGWKKQYIYSNTVCIFKYCIHIMLSYIITT